MDEERNIYNDEYNKNFITLIDYKIKQDDKALYEDAEVDRIVREDVYTILNELPNCDIYEAQLPVVRVIKDQDFIRVYGFEYGGGIAIHYKKGEYGDHYRLLTLGEDDGSYFLSSRNLFESLGLSRGQTGVFVNLVSQVLSLFNSIEK